MKDVERDTSEYQEYLNKAGEVLAGRIVSASFMDIGFVLDGREVEPKGEVQVEVRALGIVPEGTVNVVHFTQPTIESTEVLDETTLVSDVDDTALVEAELVEDELVGDTAAEVMEIKKKDDSVIFTTSSFSTFGVCYTVDFEYDGKTLHFPGQGSYKLSDVLSQLGFEGLIEEASLTLIDGEYHEGALYLEQKDGEWWISSDIAFTDTYELKVVVDGEEYKIKVTDAQETTNLNELVTNFQLSGATSNGDGTYTVKPGTRYSVDVTFTESETTKQFSDSGEMVYTLPTGVKLIGINPTFPVTVNYLGNNITINGNTSWIDDNGNLHIKFNQQDPNYSKLTAITTTQIKVHVTAVFDSNQSGNDIVIPGGGTYHVDGTPDVSISKGGKITDFDNGKIEYTLNLTSKGSNNGITIKDTLEGAALSGYDTIRGIKLYKDGVEVTGTSVSYNGKSFSLLTGALEDGNYQIKYTVNLDKNQLTSDADGHYYGQTGETKNTVEWLEKTTSHDFVHVAEKKGSWKGAGDSTTDNDGNGITPWTITAYTSPIAGGQLTTITDHILTSGTSYTGEGFYVKITDVTTGNVVKDSIFVPWTNANKTDSSWSYDVSQLPNYGNAGKYWRYDITYNTLTNMSSATQSQEIKNEGGPQGDTQTGTGVVYPPEKNRTGIEKSVVSVDDNQVTWKIKLTIPALGVAKENSYVIEHLPYHGNYKDTYVQDSFSFIGSAPTEGDPTITTESNGDIKFAWTNGFGVNTSQRTITFTFKTQYDPEWISDENASKIHQNHAKFNGDSAWAQTNYASPLFKKTGSNYIEDNGEIYFDFDVITNKITDGSFENGNIIFADTFDEHLEYVTGSATLYGGDSEYNTNTTEEGKSPGNPTIIGNTMTFSISKNMLPTQWGQFANGDWGHTGVLCAYYRLHYRMKVKNPSGITAEALLLETLTVQMNNSITSTIGSSNTTVEYTPKVLDKWQSANLNADTENHKGKVQFTIHVNESQLDLVEGDVLTLYDKIENISTAYQDINITFPKGNYQKGDKKTTIAETGQEVDLPYFNMKNDTITFFLPDGVDTVITYWAKPTGEVQADGKIHYTNTAKLKNYEKKVEENSDWSGDVSGLSTQYGVRLYKADGYENSKMLAGAEFKLFIVDEEDEDGNIISGTPLKTKSGEDKIFTSSSDGTVNIEGTNDGDGWNLKPEQRYYLMEVKAPDNCAIDTMKYSFIISSKGYTNYTRNAIVAPDGSGAIVQPWTYYNGDVLTVKNWPKTGELEITKNFTGDINNYSELNAEQKSAISFEIYQQEDESWKLIKTVGFDQFTTDNGVPKFTVGDLSAGKYKVIEKINKDYDATCIEQTYQVTISGDKVDESTEFVTINITEQDIHDKNKHYMSVTNKYDKKSEFKIYKYANRGIEGKKDIRLAGAEFGVFTVQDGVATTTQVGENYKTNGRGLFSIHPNDDTSSGIQYDTVYALKELVAPDGYKLSDTVYYFCFLGQGTNDAPSGAPTGTKTISYDGLVQEDVPNDIGTTSIGVKKIWQNDKLEEDAGRLNTSVQVKIKQIATLDKTGKNVVTEESGYYPDNFTFTASKDNGSQDNKWNLTLQGSAALPTGLSIEDGRLTGLPKMKITDNGVPLYLHYEIEEQNTSETSGYTAVYKSDTETDGSTTDTIYNRPSSVQSFVKLQAEKKWVDANKNDITNEMGVEDGVTVKVYRKEGLVKEGIIKEKSGETKNPADLFWMVMREGNGRQGSAEPNFSQALIQCLPDDIIQIVITAQKSGTLAVGDFAVQASYLKDAQNFEGDENLVGTLDSANNRITYTYTAKKTKNAFRVVSKTADVTKYNVDVINKSAQGRTQILSALEATSVGGDPVQTLELNKGNNWKAISNEFSAGHGNTVYSYYLVEDDGNDYNAEYTISGDTVLITNTDNRLRVNKKWFRPDGSTEIEQDEGNIVFNLYRVARPVTFDETENCYSNTGNLKIDLSELEFVNSGGGSLSNYTITGDYSTINKIKAGSKIQIEFTTETLGSEIFNIATEWNGSENVSLFSVTGGTLLSNDRVQTSNTQQKYKRTLVVEKVNSNIKVKGKLKADSNAVINVSVKVLGEPKEGEMPSGDALKQTHIAKVTLTKDSTSVEWEETFKDSGIKIKQDKGDWSSIISKLPDAKEDGSETYTYYVEEESISLESFVYMGIEPNNVKNGGVITIKNKAKPAKVRVTKSFEGEDSLPSGFKITNSINDVEFTAAKISGGLGTKENPYYWEIPDSNISDTNTSNLIIGEEVSFYEWNFGIDGKDMTVTDMNGNPITGPYKVTTTAVETINDSKKDTPGVVGFVNKYGSQTGSLSLTKLVTVNGKDPTDNNKQLVTGDYTFEVTGPGNYLNYIKITVTNGVASSYVIASSETGLNGTSTSGTTALLSDLIPGSYTITETNSGNMKLKSVTVDGASGTITNNNSVIVNVTSGSTAIATSATNNINTMELNIVKVDSKNGGKKLRNAKFELWKLKESEYKLFISENFPESSFSNSNQPVFTSNEQGNITINNLTHGTYKLIEKEAPAGYVIQPESKEIIINVGDGKLGTNRDTSLVTYSPATSTITIGNTPGAALPNTGGTGTTIFYSIGALLISSAALMLLRRRARL